MTLAQRIGRFHVTRPLGSGTFSTVWLARDDELDGWVAIKILAENWSYDEDARRRFTEEARALRALDSDRIVRVYDVGRLDDGRPYLVMEYADEGSLGDRMRLREQIGRPFTVDEAVGVSIEIAGCLAAVHALRIVHRDLKPTNVLFRSIAPEVREALRRSGRAVPAERMLLGDFGIARRLELSPRQTMVLGSPQYMSPEQADPETAGRVDERSDVYSAAVVLYELLAGRVPYPFGSAANVRDGHAIPAPSIHELRPDTPPALARAIERGIARDPDDRFESAWAWGDALRDASAAGPVPTLASESVRPAPDRTVTGLEAAPTSRRADPRAATDVLGAASTAGSSRTAPPQIDLGIDDRDVEEDAEPDDPGEEAFPRPGRRRLGAFDCASLAWASALLLGTATVLPWREGPTALGLEFSGGQVAIGCALAVGFGALLRTLFRRRWTMGMIRLLALVGGMVSLGAAAYDALQVHRLTRLSGSAGPGLYVLLAGSGVALIAWARARRQFRRSRPSPLANLPPLPPPPRA